MRIDGVWAAESCGAKPNFKSLYDDEVRRAAQHGLTIIAYLYGEPNGCPKPESGARFPLPATTAYKGWTETEGIAAEAVKRYGFNGTFWSENPSVPYHPIEDWEVWNEENYDPNIPEGYGPQQYAKLLIDMSASIRKAQAAISSSTPVVLMGGLAQFSAAYTVSSFLSSMYTNPPKEGAGAYTAAELHAAFNGLGLHPSPLGATANAKDAEIHVEEARTALNNNGDSGKTIWVTELGWGVGAFGGSPTAAQQAQYLKESFNWLQGHRSEYKIEVAAWFMLRDVKALGSWAATSGLKDETGDPRAAWCEFLTLNGRHCAKPVSAGATPSISRDPSSGYIFETYRNSEGEVAYSYKAPNEGWVSANLGGTKVAAGTSPVMVRDQATQHVFIAYRNTSGGISYWVWSEAEGWKNATLGGSVAPETSPGLVWTPTFIAIYYHNGTGGMSYFYWFQGAWSNLNLGGTNAASKTSPKVERDPSSGYTFVIYRTTNGNIGYWAWSPSGTGWFSGILTANISLGTDPALVRSENPEHVFIAYRDAGTEGISFAYWTPSEGWVLGLPLNGGEKVYAGTSPSLTWTPEYTGIAYVNKYSGISQWYWTWPSGWVNFNLPTDGWVGAPSSVSLTRDAATGNASIGYVNQGGHEANLTWLYEIPGSWMQVVP